MRLLLFVVALLLNCNLLWGQSTGPLEIARGLESNTFAERREAMSQLRRLGQKAHEAIILTAEQGSAEARTRALAILEEQLHSPDADLQESAKTALTQLAQGKNATARLAQSILAPPPEIPERMAQRLQMRAVQLRAIQMRFGRAEIAARQQIPAAVGRYSITLNENGRKITVKGSEKGIQLEVTETNQDGKRVTNRYEAKNAAELKANHPEASKIFEQMRQRYGLRDPNP